MKKGRLTTEATEGHRGIGEFGGKWASAGHADMGPPGLDDLRSVGIAPPSLHSEPAEGAGSAVGMTSFDLATIIK